MNNFLETKKKTHDLNKYLPFVHKNLENMLYFHFSQQGAPTENSSHFVQTSDNLKTPINHRVNRFNYYQHPGLQCSKIYNSGSDILFFLLQLHVGAV